MALCWDEKKIALEIDDDLLSAPFEPEEGWEVIHVTTNELCCYESFNRIMKRLHTLLGDDNPEEDYPRDLFEFAREHVDSVRRYSTWATKRLYPYEDQDWEGEVPPDSLVTLKDGKSYATPEFKFLMSAATEPFARTVQLGLELCGCYATDHNQASKEYMLLGVPYCTLQGLRDYLRGARECIGYEQAMEALSYVVENALSPMDTYLIACLCLPPELGGYDLMRPEAGGYCDNEEDGMGRAPSEEGPFLAYDLCWPWCRVVLQYVGKRTPTERERRSLAVKQTYDLDPICVTTREVRDPEAFEQAALLLASKLGTTIPEADDTFLAARSKLRAELDFPNYDHMALTYMNAHFHEML